MDHRITSSKAKIKEAFIELVVDSNSNKITIIDICEKANVNRSTFYERFQYLDNLIDEIIDDEVHIISTKIISKILNPESLSKQVIKEFIMAFLDSKILLALILNNDSHNYQGIIISKLVDKTTRAENKEDYYIAFFQNVGVLALIIQWIKNKKDIPLDSLVNIIYNFAQTLNTLTS